MMVALMQWFQKITIPHGLPERASQSIPLGISQEPVELTNTSPLSATLTRFSQLEETLAWREQVLNTCPNTRVYLYLLDKVQSAETLGWVKLLLAHGIPYRFVHALPRLQDQLVLDLILLRAEPTDYEVCLKPYVLEDALAQFPHAESITYIHAAQPNMEPRQVFNCQTLLGILPFWQAHVAAGLLKNVWDPQHLEADFFESLSQWRRWDEIAQPGLVRPKTATSTPTGFVGPSYFETLPGTTTALPSAIRQFWWQAKVAPLIRLFHPQYEVMTDFWNTTTQRMPYLGGLNRFLYWLWQQTPALYQTHCKVQFRQSHPKRVIQTVKQNPRAFGLASEWLQKPQQVLPVSFGLNCLGFVSLRLGQGEAIRSFFQKAQPLGLPMSLCDIRISHHSRIPDAELTEYLPHMTDLPVYDRNFVFQNGSEFALLAKSPVPYFKGRYNIGVPWWEFESGFDHHLKGFRHMDEILVFSEFLYQVFSQATRGRIPVRQLPFPFVPQWKLDKTPLEARRHWGMDPEERVFFFSFDYYSSFLRKNPEGVLRAFAKALKDQPHVRLVLKTIGSEAYPEAARHIQQLLGTLGIAEKTQVIDVSLSRNDLMTLMNATDCYVSLHRGEGLGLGMLEAMWLGKPVIATQYGGNMSFMTPDTGLLVPYEMVPATDTHAAYKDVQFWAEPSVSVAAEYMAQVAANPPWAQTLGQLGQAHVHALYEDKRFLQALLVYLEGQ